MAGDKRALYLGWLNAVCQDYTDVEDDDVEPPVPPGLLDLSPALTDLADFVRIDFDLIAVAAQRSEPLAPAADDPATMRKWLSATPAKQKDEWLWRVLQGEEFGLRSEMMRDFQQSQNPKKPAAEKGDKSSRRTAGELRKAAEAYGEKRRQTEAEQRATATARKQREAAAAQAKRLKALSGKEKTAWERVGSWIASKDSDHYDKAVDMLVDLKGLAQQNNQVQAFVSKVQEIRKQNASKQALLRRLKKAALY